MTITPQTLGQFDHQEERARVRVLEGLTVALNGFDATEDDAAFSNLFSQAQVILEIDDLLLARLMQTSRPTIGRWARGQTAPHPLARAAVFRVLAGIVAARLKLHRSKPFVRLELDLKMRAARPNLSLDEASRAATPLGGE
jgi:hypothetical protein